MFNKLSLKRLQIILLVITCVYLCTSGAYADSPNIIWIVSEDNSPLIGAYGDEFATTPHLDNFASESVVFDNAYANTPVCSPARFTLITGMYANSMGTENMRSYYNIPDFIQFFPKYLKEKGYYLTNNAKEDYNTTTQPGTWDESSKKATYENRKAGQPFFHIKNIATSHESRLHGKFDTLRHDPDNVPVPPYHPQMSNTKKDWARYYDQIEKMDAEVGKILDELETAGLKEDTIIFYFSDHGGALSRGKRFMYESGLKVPLIIYFPEKYKHLAPGKAGTRTDRLVSFVDFAPTVLSLADIRPPEYMHGNPFLGRYNSKSSEYIYAYRGRMGERRDLVRAVRDKKYLYRRNYFPNRIYGQYLGYLWRADHVKEWESAYHAGDLNEVQSRFWEPKPVEELYNVKNDPHNVTNLADEPKFQDILERMRNANKKFVRNIEDIGFIPESIIARMSEKGSAYDYVRSENIPLKKIIDTAERASKMNSADYDILLRRLNHANESVRYWAAQGFVMMGEDAKRFKDSLMEKTSDSSIIVQIALSEAIFNIGESSKAIDILNKGLEASQEMIRLQALHVLSNLNLQQVDIINSLASNIKSLSKADDFDPSGSYDVRVAQRLVEQLKL